MDNAEIKGSLTQTNSDKKTITESSQSLYLNNSTVHGPIIQLIGADFDLVDVPTISETFLIQTAKTLLENFRPHNLLREFQNIDPKITSEVAHWR